MMNNKSEDSSEAPPTKKCRLPGESNNEDKPTTSDKTTEPVITGDKNEKDYKIFIDPQ